MRKTSAAIAGLSLIALALTGCATAPSFEGQVCDRTDAADGIDGSVQVEGDFGITPDIEVFAPVALDEPSFTDVIEGEGTPLTTANQVFQFDYALFDGATGAQIEQSEFDGEQTARLTNIAMLSQSLPGVEAALQCATPGTRVVAGIPTERGPIVAVIDVIDAQLARATGSLQFNDARGLPTVVRAADGRPGIIVPDADAPTEQVVQVLIKGDGPVVEGDAEPWVNYTSVGWDSKEQTGTSWGGTPDGRLSDTSAEVAASLVGNTVGSQVMVVLPATDGAAASVYVVDILGTGTPSGQ